MMTTPERLRRRQLTEGVVLIILSVFLVGMAVNEQHRDADQRACVAENFEELTEALETRAQLAADINALRDRQRDLIQRRLDALIDLFVTSAQDPDRSEEESAALRARFFRETDEFKRQTERLKREIAEAKAEQQKIPIPAYPRGVCES